MKIEFTKSIGFRVAAAVALGLGAVICVLFFFLINDAGIMSAGHRRVLILSAGAALLSAIIISLFLIRKFIGVPLAGLMSKMEEVEKGNLNAMVDVRGDDELAIIGNKFNNMVSSMRECHTRIVESHLSEHLTLFNIAEILNRSDSVEEASSLILDAVNIGFGVDEGSIMSLTTTGSARLNGYVGLSEEKAQAVKSYMDSILAAAPSMSEGKSDIRDKLTDGGPFIVDGGAGVGVFMAVPLKSSGRLVGVITIHRLKGKEIREIVDMGEINRLFLIVSTQVSPYMFIGLCMDEKRMMKTSPFSCFLDLISEHIEKVREYSGFVSIAVIKVENYSELCETHGVDRASLRVQEAGSAMSSAIEAVHEATRITEIKIVVILPMKDKFEAGDIIDGALAGIGEDIKVKYKIVSYPDEGETPIQLMYLAYV